MKGKISMDKIGTIDLESLVDRGAAARFFGISDRSFAKRVAEGLIPTVRVPGMKHLRFRPSTLRQIAEQNETVMVGGEVHEVSAQ